MNSLPKPGEETALVNEKIRKTIVTGSQKSLEGARSSIRYARRTDPELVINIALIVGIQFLIFYFITSMI